MLVSLPVQWAGQLAAMLSPAAAAELLAIAWRIGRDGRIGRASLIHRMKCSGPPAAYAAAERWMAVHPQAEIANWAGLLAAEAGDLPAARAWLIHGRACGDDADGLGEMLEIAIAQRADAAERAEVVNRLSGRRDLPPMVRRYLLEEQATSALMGRDFDAARRGARHLVSVEDNPKAEMILWAAARHAGEASAAARHLARAAKGLPPGPWNYWRCLGAWAVGDVEESRAALVALRENDERLAAAASVLVGSPGDSL